MKNRIIGEDLVYYFEIQVMKGKTTTLEIELARLSTYINESNSSSIKDLKKKKKKKKKKKRKPLLLKKNNK